MTRTALHRSPQHTVTSSMAAGRGFVVPSVQDHEHVHGPRAAKQGPIVPWRGVAWPARWCVLFVHFVRRRVYLVAKAGTYW